jgi:hypothetical protein
MLHLNLKETLNVLEAEVGRVSRKSCHSVEGS